MNDQPTSQSMATAHELCNCKQYSNDTPERHNMGVPCENCLNIARAIDEAKAEGIKEATLIHCFHCAQKYCTTGKCPSGYEPSTFTQGDK